MTDQLPSALPLVAPTNQPDQFDMLQRLTGYTQHQPELLAIATEHKRSLLEKRLKQLRGE
ncbi:MAG TPA: hypothetical protein DEF47_08215 [Herpetosiphon sp.]|uniref:hypothetical protein n=1 Tax=Herpetosiphon sp. TaxID=71864 RepID=UPI00059E099B|nr:hypothetical protein [Herpetosiphon sp.]HBW49877.1 hypothetical protein [Herpetosiphon sp.]